jgi:hypothetical protein
MRHGMFEKDRLNTPRTKPVLKSTPSPPSNTRNFARTRSVEFEAKVEVWEYDESAGKVDAQGGTYESFIQAPALLSRPLQPAMLKGGNAAEDQTARVRRNLDMQEPAGQWSHNKHLEEADASLQRLEALRQAFAENIENMFSGRVQGLPLL